MSVAVMDGGGAFPFFSSADPPALTPAKVDPIHVSSAPHPVHCGMTFSRLRHAHGTYMAMANHTKTPSAYICMKVRRRLHHSRCSSGNLSPSMPSTITIDREKTSSETGPPSVRVCHCRPGPSLNPQL